MKRKSHILFATLLVALASNVTVKADTHFVVRSESDCPSGQAVTEALRTIRPDEESIPLATIHVKGDRTFQIDPSPVILEGGFFWWSKIMIAEVTGDGKADIVLKPPPGGSSALILRNTCP